MNILLTNKNNVLLYAALCLMFSMPISCVAALGPMKIQGLIKEFDTLLTHDDPDSFARAQEIITRISNSGRGSQQPKIVSLELKLKLNEKKLALTEKQVQKITLNAQQLLEALQAENQQLHKENEQLTNAIHELTESKQELARQLEECEKISLRHEIGDIFTDPESLRDVTIAEENARKKLQKELKDLEDENMVLRTQLVHAKQDLQNAQQELAGLKNR